MAWWMWLAFGMALLLLEMATPSGFFLLFFGVGAITAAIVASFNLVPASVEWLVFTASALIYLFMFRERLKGRVDKPAAEVDTLIGELVLPRERMAPGQTGRVELRGTLWNARNDSPVTLETGQRCRVASVDGLVVFIQPE